MSTVADQAKEFADLGYNVFPLNKKIPILKRWPDLATTDHTIIDEWYSGFASKADGFGVCPKDQCVIIDVDVKDGKKGFQSLKWLISNFSLPRDTQVIKTKSGGLHLYYKYPKLLTDQHIKSVSNWTINGMVLDGIDIRGNRGQCVGPTSSNGYSIVSLRHVGELAELPDGLVSVLPVDKVGGLKVDAEEASSLVVYDNPDLKGVIPDIIPEGGRHQTLLSLTASWARKVPYPTACVLLKEAIDRCEGSEIKYEDYKVRLDDAYDKFEPVVDDKLQWMLDHLVYVVHSNSVYRLDKSGVVANIPMSTATNYFKNWTVLVDKKDKDGSTSTKAVSCFQSWMSHQERQTIERVGYKPVDDLYYVCGVLGERIINSYKKSNIIPSKGSVTWFTNLVQFLWGPESELILDYCAHIIQNPTVKIHWSPLLITPHEGMGKNLFFEILSRCVGKWNSAIINAALLSKTFNLYLVENLIVLVNEVQEVSNKERQVVVSKLKSYITESVQAIEGKGDNLFTAEIYSNFFIFSNKRDAIDVEDTSRRFHVYINESKPKSDEWYANVASHLNDDSISHLVQFLSDRDISDFGWAGHAPHTASRTSVVTSNMSEYELEIRQHIEFKQHIFVSDVITDASWQYYVNHVLHKGQRMSVAQEKYLKHLLLTRIRSTINSRTKSRQFTLPSISKLSDENSIVKESFAAKTLAYTVRNHDKYVHCDTNNVPATVISDEYNKIFKSKKSSLSVV